MARTVWNQNQIDLTAQLYTRPLIQKMVHETFNGARFLAPEGDHVSGSGKAKAGPTIVRSLYSDFKSGPRRILGTVGAKARHSMTVHQGSQAHTIFSKRGKMLKFRWDRGDFLVAARAGRRRGNRRTGQFHFFVSVRHPGNKRPVRFLTTPLEMFGRLNGFRVTSGSVTRSRLP